MTLLPGCDKLSTETSTDRIGKLATIPVVVEFVNKANTMPSARKVMEKTLGVAAASELPPYAKETFSFISPAHAGVFRWQCLVPCGGGFIDGNSGPMQTLGYMMGEMDVVSS